MNRTLLMIFAFAVACVLSSCDRFEIVDPIIRNSPGDALLINANEADFSGIDTLRVNEDDIMPLVITSAIASHEVQYTVEVADGNALSIEAVPDQPRFYTVQATAPEGTVTTLSITDHINNITKELPVIITKYWADPVFFDKIGEFDGHHYYKSKFKTLWTGAVSMCAFFGINHAHLASMNSKEENNFLKDGIEGDNVWIGMTFLYGNEDLSKWFNQEDVTFQYWYNSSNPDVPGSRPYTPGIFKQNFVYMRPDGFWTIEKETPMYFVLEIDEY